MKFQNFKKASLIDAELNLLLGGTDGSDGGADPVIEDDILVMDIIEEDGDF